VAIRVGVVRDSRYLEHRPGLVHPESPNRLRAVYRMLDKEFVGNLVRIEPEFATLEQLELVHSPAYVQQILSTAERDFTNLSPDTAVSARTYVAAWLAVGGCLKALDALLNDHCRACFSLIRPPGHHALPDRAGGFCIFNNLGVTARYAIDHYGLERILIIDWDIHHGNAIQDLFYSDRRVFYLSSHYMGWYPHSGDWLETGEGEGAGYNLNLPVPKELEDEDIIHVYRDVLNAVVRRFKPELILVAAGFDGHHRDPLGRTRLTEKAYGRLTQIVLQMSEAARSAPLLFALEGGYDNWAVATSVKEVLGVLTFDGRREKIPSTRTARGSQILVRAREVHARYNVWTS
jgi:acetoin utilization deacetylase AcuC-like enzyme